MKFNEFGLNDQLLDGLDAMGFEKATPVQEKAIPSILAGKDIIACAQTGTGKTAAFLLPLIHKLMNRSGDTVDALIMVPTRELAVQIDQQLEGFAYFTEISSLPIYGGRDGASFEDEKKALRLGANIVVATPGRLIAHLNLGYVKIDKLQCLILDEADRMLDMGFINDLQKIISYLPAKRQTLMFSATMPHKIRKFSKKILHNPEQINLAISKPATGIIQVVYFVEDAIKVDLLDHLLKSRTGKKERILIFSSTKANVKKIAATLASSGLDVSEIHSDLDQKRREDTLRSFKNGNLQVLVATDILSRGIDVKDINLVINYDVPSDAEDYIHRIGRTARADTEGVALTFINRRERRKLDDIERLMETKVKRLQLPEFLQKKEQTAAASNPKRKPFKKYNKGGGGRNYDRRR